ncbi:hypothetical protein GZH46_02971 [Fragariocoptes setiger]|uniref:Uncharacterized protein n=1 Tax=Fragariocoptes setiger TaxID=1670756 RepID=A0ABQ7S545_9ACAR|nr:hypothetical protein GZH46_02971 [Fragariocoptes setiger]
MCYSMNRNKHSKLTNINMNKQIILSVALVVLVLVAVVSASGYGGGYGMGYGQNYDRKVGFKTTIYHPYGAVSNRFDHRTYPAYSAGYAAPSYGGDHYAPAPNIQTGLDYIIGDIPKKSYQDGY